MFPWKKKLVFGICIDRVVLGVYSTRCFHFFFSFFLFLFPLWEYGFFYGGREWKISKSIAVKNQTVFLDIYLQISWLELYWEKVGKGKQKVVKPPFNIKVMELYGFFFFVRVGVGKRWPQVWDLKTCTNVIVFTLGSGWTSNIAVKDCIVLGKSSQFSP